MKHTIAGFCQTANTSEPLEGTRLIREKIAKGLGRLGGAVGDAAGGAGGAGEGACSAAGQCFAAGTLVQMADGTTKPIEQVKAGDWVASRDAEKTEKSHDKVKSGESVGKQVARSFVTEKMPTVKVTFSNGETIQCTTGHPFYVEGKGFTPAGRLAIGNAIVTRAGPNVSVRKVEQAETATVYNFEVDGTHTYFVGKTQAWVHNICFPDNLLQSKFKHAADFGIEGNYSPENAKLFQQALEDHIANAQQITGTYRGAGPVTHYYNPATDLWVGVNGQDIFISGWKLGAKQIAHLLSHGNVQ